MTKIITTKKKIVEGGYESLYIYVNGEYVANVFANKDSVQAVVHSSDGRISSFDIDSTESRKMFTCMFYQNREVETQ